MNLNLSGLATIFAFVSTAVGGTWIALDSIHVKIDGVRQEIRKADEHHHSSYISRNEYREDIEKIISKIERLDRKLDERVFYLKKK